MKHVLRLSVHIWTSVGIRESYVKPCCQNCKFDNSLYEANDTMQHATKYYTFSSWKKTEIWSQATRTLGGTTELQQHVQKMLLTRCCKSPLSSQVSILNSDKVIYLALRSYTWHEGRFMMQKEITTI